MRIEKITRGGKEFAIVPIDRLKKLMEDAETLADVKAYDAAKGRLERGKDEIVPLEINGTPLSRRKCGQGMAGASGNDTGESREGVRRLPADDRGYFEAGHKRGGIATLKKLAEALRIDLDHLA